VPGYLSTETASRGVPERARQEGRGGGSRWWCDQYCSNMTLLTPSGLFCGDAGFQLESEDSEELPKLLDDVLDSDDTTSLASAKHLRQ
jgi:hypothetical protein